MSPSDDAAVVRRMQIVDMMRSVPIGIAAPLETSVLLTIAIKHFHTTGLVKGIIAAGAGVGYLSGPVITAAARRSRRPAMVAAAVVVLLGGLGYLVASAGSLPLFVVGSVVGIASTSAVVPLMTRAYDSNFPSTQRGRRVGVGLATKVAASAATGLAMGAYLSGRIDDRWWVVVLVGAVALIAVAFLQLQMPSRPVERVPGRHNRPWPHFELLREDRRLRLTLTAWMIMGFGNLMLLPLRVEYLARPKYGINATAAKITLLTVTVPALLALAAMPVFGFVFDRLTFFAARISVNLFIAGYIVVFFTGTSNPTLLTGAVLYGIGSAGGDLMWNLWVVKFAPVGRVADYMGLHTFFTGIRGVVAPILGFVIIGRMSLVTVAWISTGLILGSALMLVPEARAERRARPVSP